MDRNGEKVHTVIWQPVLGPLVVHNIQQLRLRNLRVVYKS